jgi:hypothetical protein
MNPRFILTDKVEHGCCYMFAIREQQQTPILSSNYVQNRMFCELYTDDHSEATKILNVLNKAAENGEL